MSDDLRDRFRRDYRSASAPPRRPAPVSSGVQNHVGDITPPRAEHNPPSTTNSTPAPAAPVQPPHPGQQPQPVRTSTPPTAMPSRPPERPPEAISAPKQAQAPSRSIVPSKRSKMRVLRNVVFIVIILGLMGSIGAGSAYAYQHVRPTELPISYVKNSKFAVYYPFSLPEGYYVDKTSFNIEDNALVFTIRNAHDSKKSVPVSEQALPANFNPDKQLPEPSGNDTGQRGTYSTTAGKGAIGSFQGNQVATLAAGNTWIIMNVSAIPAGEVGGIASSFERVSPLPVLSPRRWYYVKNS